MNQKQNPIRNFLKQFISFLFVVGMILAMLAPLTSAASSADTRPSASGGGGSSNTQGDTSVDSTGTTTKTPKVAPGATATPVVNPGAYKDDFIYIPLDGSNYPDFPQLRSSSPTGMLNEFVNGIIQNLKYIIGSVAVVFIIVSAIKLIISQGNEDTISKQKNAMLYGILGLALIAFGDELARVMSVACIPGQVECADGGFLKDPSNMITQAAIFKRETRIFITFVKYIIGGIAVLMFVRNGIRLIGLAGSEESVTIDKKNLMYTSVGLLLIILASTAVDKVLYIVDPAQYTTAGLAPAINPSKAVLELVGVTNTAVFIVAPISIFMLIVGAVMYATAGGKEEQMTKAKKLIILTVVGIALIYGSFAIVSTIVAGQFNP